MTIQTVSPIQRSPRHLGSNVGRLNTAVGNIDRIQPLRKLLGDAVLLPWRSGSKGDRRKWRHLHLRDMNDDTHIARLERAGNIGVALGKVSGGLITIDLDEDGYVDGFLDANPLLTNTLRTRGSRGCNIWVRCSSGYPPSQKLRSSLGVELGEWRADGNQTIVAGIHPGGMAYEFLVENPVITMKYESIVWPDSILPPDATESKRVRGVRRVRGEEGVRENKVVCVPVCVQEMQLYFPADVMSQIAPKDYHQNNASLFKLARLVKSYEKAIGRPATPEELKVVFDRWCFGSRPFWRHTRQEYWAEFLQAYHYARIGLHENPIELAFSSARSKPLPDVTGFEDERVRLLAAVCREMRQLVGDNPFFLPTRKLGELLGAHWGNCRTLVNCTRDFRCNSPRSW
jgi:hypothetical protein